MIWRVLYTCLLAILLVGDIWFFFRFILRDDGSLPNPGAMIIGILAALALAFIFILGIAEQILFFTGNL